MDAMNLCATGIAKAIRNGKIVVNEVEYKFKRNIFFVISETVSENVFKHERRYFHHRQVPANAYLKSLFVINDIHQQ